MLKRFFSLLLAILMVFTLLPQVSARTALLPESSLEACGADLSTPVNSLLVADYGEDTFRIKNDGRMYLVNYFNNTSEPTAIANATSVLCIGQQLFVSQEDDNGHVIVCYSLPDLKGSIVFRSSRPIDQFCFGSNTVYFRSNGSVYAQEIGSSEVRTLYRGTDAEHIYLDDADTLVYRLPAVPNNTSYNDPCVSSEVIETSFRVDLASGTVMGQAAYEAAQPHVEKREFTGHSYSITVGSVTLPLPEYPHNSYCTTTGYACSNHNACRRYYTYNGTTVDTYGWQCCGFARYVFWRCFGVVPFPEVASGSGYYHAVGTVSSSSISLNYLKSIFGSTVKAGAHIRTNTGVWGSQHSLAYMGYDDTYVYTYEGNYGNTCQVKTVARTWSETVSYYTNTQYGIQYIDMPTSHPGTSEDVPSEYLDPIVFNVAYYKSVNPDLTSMTDSQAKQHWIDHGVKEGRIASPVFNVMWYVDNHTDLKNAFGTDYGSAIKHFINSGVKEGRNSCANFNFSYYKANYPDLVSAFGSSNYSYYKHYIDYGVNEQRIANRKLVNLVSGVYTLASVGDSTLQLNVNGTAIGSGTIISTAAATDSQRFVFEKAGGNIYYYKIRNLASNLYLGMSDGAIKLADFADNNNFKWHVIDNGDGTVTISNHGNSYNFDVDGAVYADGTTVKVWTNNGNNAQKWKMTLVPLLPDGVYSIAVSSNSDFVLDIAEQSSADKANLQLYTDCGVENQKFAVYHNADGYYTLRALHSDKCVDVTNGLTASGSNIAQYTDNGTVAQQWSVLRNPDGAWSFISRCNGLAMDVTNASYQNGQNIQCYAYNGTNAQKWTMLPVTTARVNAEGDLLLVSAVDSGFVAEIVDGNVQSGEKTGMPNQIFHFTDLENGYYTMQTLTGQYIGVSDGTVKLSAVTEPTTAELWQLMPHADGTVGILSAVNGYYFNLRNGKPEVADIFPYHYHGDAASRWSLTLNPHTHTFTDTITPPTCTEKGYTTHFCTDCGGTVVDTYVDALGHDRAQSNVVTPAGCLTDGVTEYTCSRCGYVDTVTVPAFGHSYLQEHVDASCVSEAGMLYTCEHCGDSYLIPDEPVWSDWMDEIPEEYQNYLTTSRTLYRYADKETTTSYETSLPGYTQTGSSWQQSGSGTVSYVSSWPSGFSTSHSLYSQYHKSAPSASETATTKRTVGGASTVGYIYWHWCQNSYTDGPINRYVSDVYESGFPGFHAFYSTTAPSSLTCYDTVYQHANAACCKDTYWYFALEVKSQSYADYKKLFTYEKWGDWSQWSETPVEANDNRQVETRVQYAYAMPTPAGGHDWDDGAYVGTYNCTKENTLRYTCKKCGELRDETVPATGHTVVEDPGVPATCENDGLTDGSHCSVCNTVLVAQTVIPAGGHDIVRTTTATCTEAGIATVTCSKCDLRIAMPVAALGHSYELYTNNGSNHTVQCVRCTSSFSEEHSYVDHICVCGARENTDSQLNFYVSSISLEERIIYTALVSNNVLSQYDSFYVEFTNLDSSDDRMMLHGTDEGTAYGTKYTLFQFPVYACQMTDRISATIYAVKDGVTYQGQTVVRSVEEFVLGVIGSLDSKMQTMCANMLEYGAALQTYFDYRTEHLANDELGEYAALVLRTVPTVTGSYTTTSTGRTGAVLRTRALGIGSVVQLQYAYKLSGISIDAVYAEVVVAGKTTRIEGSDFINAGSTYVLVFDELLPTQADTDVQITLYSNGTAISETCTDRLSYGVSGYQSSSDANLCSLANAMLNYYRTAELAFAQ